MSEHRPAFGVRKGNPGFDWVVDIMWPDGETEVIKGFATELLPSGTPLNRRYANTDYDRLPPVTPL
jgi:hypothetical protein